LSLPTSLMSMLGVEALRDNLVSLPVLKLLQLLNISSHSMACQFKLSKLELISHLPSLKKDIFMDGEKQKWVSSEMEKDKEKLEDHKEFQFAEKELIKNNKLSAAPLVSVIQLV